MLDLSTRLIHRDCPVPDYCQMDTKWKKIFGALWYSLCLPLPLQLSPFSLLASFFVTLPSIHSTILIYNAELIDATQTRNTQVQNDRQILRVCGRARARAERIACVACLCIYDLCLCPFEMDKGYGCQVLLVSDWSVSYVQWSAPAELPSLVLRRPPCWKIGDGTILK
jgi:hypothetical protein